MSNELWKELTKQVRLEEMYETFRNCQDATDKNTAIRLARFAEACMFCKAERHIEKLKEEHAPAHAVLEALLRMGSHE